MWVDDFRAIIGMHLSLSPSSCLERLTVCARIPDVCSYHEHAHG